MDEQKINDRIKNFILQQGINIDIISKSKIDKLEKIDKVIQRKLQILENAKNEIDKNKINISSIAIETGISRKTFYNNELFRLYVESYISENSNSKSVKIEEFNKLVEKYNLAVEQTNLLIMRDIDFENLKYENEQILKENNMLKDRIIMMEEELEKSKRELFKVQKTLAKIIPFEKNDGL